MNSTAAAPAVQAWLTLPERIERAVQGLADEALDWRGGADGYSIRETVHHLVEANLVAANIVIAALAKSGCTYDWSWVTPDAAWAQRVGYTTAPTAPALSALRALGLHLAGVIGAAGGGLERQVRLVDTPGAEPYTKTVEEILLQEVEHAQEHLQDVAETRAAHAS